MPLAMTIGGRVQQSHPVNSDDSLPLTYLSQWPGSYFAAAFQGTAVFLTVGTNNEILHITVDKSEPLLLKRPAEGVYKVSGLKKGDHTVKVEVVTESQPAPNAFGGLGIAAGEKALLLPVKRRQIEFIGDSHTVGYGNTSPKQQCTNEEVWAATDTSKAFGPLTAAHFKADYQIDAISGRGVVRNYNGSAGATLPQAYPYVLFNQAQKYADATWKPQVIVIALGTNDFSTPLHKGEKWKTRDELHADFENTYVAFLRDLRARNPGAYIVVWATKMANGEIETEVQKVIVRLQSIGERNMEYLPIDTLGFTACQSHPSVADDEAIAAQLVQLIANHKRVWWNQ